MNFKASSYYQEYQPEALISLAYNVGKPSSLKGMGHWRHAVSLKGSLPV
jgi:hypothetical protein